MASERYTSKYLDVHWTPQWPFGHGLSYTTFAYDSLRLSADSLRMGDSLAVTVSVRNTGGRQGDEIVQLYVRDDAASVTRPMRALKGFARISLQPGEARDRAAHAAAGGPLALRSDDAARSGAGEFTVWMGGSSDGGLEGRFRAVGDTLVLETPPPRLR